MSLSVTLTPTTPQNNPSHSAMHNEINHAHNLFWGGDYSLRQLTLKGNDSDVDSGADFVYPGGVPSAGPRRVGIYDGYNASPVTSMDPTVVISRNERVLGATIAAAGVNQAGAALYVVNRGYNDTHQYNTVALQLSATQLGYGDAVGLAINSTINSDALGTGQTAFGLFLGVASYRLGQFAIGINPVVATLDDQPYVSSGENTSGIFTQPYPASGTPVLATITIASPGVITQLAHAALVNRPVVFATTGALPTGLVAGTVYYIKTVLTANTFTVSATVGGAAINTTGSQSGIHSAYIRRRMGVGYVVETAVPNQAVFDVAFGAATNSVDAAFLSDDSDSVIHDRITGTHTSIIDASAATITGNHIIMESHFTLGIPLGNPRITLDGGAANDYIDYIRASNLFRVMVADVSQLQVTGGTPGANATTLSILEGAGPTLRQVQWKAGNALGVGDKVMVLV